MINRNQCSKWKWRQWFLSGHCKSPALPSPLLSFVIVMLLTLATCQCVLHKCHQSVFIFICKCSLNSWHHNVIKLISPQYNCVDSWMLRTNYLSVSEFHSVHSGVDSWSRLSTMWLEWGPRRNEVCTVCVLCSLLHPDSVLCRPLSQQGNSEGLPEGCRWKPHHHLPPATGRQAEGHTAAEGDPGEGHTAAEGDPGERAGKSCDSFWLVSIDSSSPSDNGGLYSDSSHWPWFWTVGWQQGVLTSLWHHTDPVSDSGVKNSILTYLWCHPDPGCRQYGDRTGHYDLLVVIFWPHRCLVLVVLVPILNTACFDYITVLY